MLVHSLLTTNDSLVNGDLKDEVCVEKPLGFEISERKNMVYRLHKALHGLKEVLKAWHDKTSSNSEEVNVELDRPSTRLLYVVIECRALI